MVGAGKSSTKRVALAIALTITAITVCIIVLVLVYCLPFRYKKKASLRFPDTSQDLDGKLLTLFKCRLALNHLDHPFFLFFSGPQN